MSDNHKKNKKIIVLGGGIGSLSAALSLSEAQPEADITVVQPGWRLGGKGASGRNLESGYYERIEEHGLHVWSGLYDNAFRLLRKCFTEIDRPEGAPLGTWQKAFERSNEIIIWEEYQNEWRPWKITVPQNGDLPGEPDAKPLLPLGDYVNEAIKYIFKKALDSDNWRYQITLWSFIKIFLWFLGSKALTFIAWIGVLLGKFVASFPILRKLAILELKIYLKIYWFFVKNRLDNDEVRRRWLILNFGFANISGLLEADILNKGFNSIDDQDYRTWLKPFFFDDNGLSINSPLVEFIYDAQFSYKKGDLNKGDIAAGAALKTIIRMALSFKGSLIWKMQAGMGDTIFTPIYQALKKRGVKFEFFTQIQKLKTDGKKITQLVLAKQMKLKDNLKEYQPLVDVKGLACWPSKPLMSQLEGELPPNLDFDRINHNLPTYTLDLGADFDQVILGIPIGCLPDVCEDLIAIDKRWQAMLDGVKTVRTQAMQLWFKALPKELGMVGKGYPLTVCYHATPLNTFANMTELIPREGWPALGTAYPQSLFYLCGPLGDDEDHIKTAEKFMKQQLGPILPKAVGEDGSVIWEYLVDDRNAAVGPERLKSQYLRGNITPSERFTLSLAGSQKLRLKPGDSGFSNLFLAGDWTDNSFNIANIEATVMSGMLASNAMCGYPEKKDIVGYEFGEPKKD